MQPAKVWVAGVITIAATFVVTFVFIYVVHAALSAGPDSVRLPLLIVAGVVGLLGAIGFIVVAFSLNGLINAGEPLGLPEGSVRALMALLILVIFASMTIFFFGALKNAPKGADMANANDVAKQVLTILGTLLTAISSFYFGTQSVTSAVKAAAGGGAAGGGAAGGGASAGGGGGQGGGGGAAGGGGAGGGGGQGGGGGAAGGSGAGGGGGQGGGAGRGEPGGGGGGAPQSGGGGEQGARQMTDEEAREVATLQRTLPVSPPLRLKPTGREKFGMEEAE